MSGRSYFFLQATLSFLFIGMLIGCSSQQKIMIKSEPSQAKVFIDTVDAGITPCTIKVKKKGPEPIIRLEKKGYAPKEVPLDKRFNLLYPINIVFTTGGLFAANLLKSSIKYGYVSKGDFIGSCFGLGVGIAGLVCGIFTGDYYKFKPQKIDLSLDKLDAKINTIIKEKNASGNNSDVIGNNNEKYVIHTVNLPEHESKLSDKELEIGTPITIVTHTEKEF